MGITAETRREAYYEAKERAPRRRKLILRALNEYGPMTAEELADRLGFSDKNAVRPRLTELKDDGLIFTIGKRRARSGRLTAVWEANND